MRKLINEGLTYVAAAKRKRTTKHEPRNSMKMCGILDCMQEFPLGEPVIED